MSEPTQNPFPLGISEKQDNWEKLQLLIGSDPSLSLTAAEVNKILRAIQYLYENAVNGGSIPPDLSDYITTQELENESSKAVKFIEQNKTALEKAIAIENLGAQKKVTTDRNLSITANGKIETNVMPFEEIFNYSGGNPIFELERNADYIDRVILNGLEIDRFSQYLLTELNKIEIINQALSLGDKVKVNYKSFKN